ncbi:MAG: threonine ammonia-lyase IlvA [Flavobacteriaceae bacterium]|nr:MAG: threonine ammonia-lyase IlvA [Flavobacteriaceae bacterium]
MKTETIYRPTVATIRDAAANLKGVALRTPLIKNDRYSRSFLSNIFFKREDLQPVRSYKIRGAYNKISSLTKEEQKKGIICASAGNHAQGVALSCKLLKIHGIIYMPAPTPKQKIDQVKMFGEEYIDVILTGDSFDDAQYAARLESNRLQKAFIHPFDDEKIIEGQATVGLEILEQAVAPVDYIFVPVGGGGLLAGLLSYVKQVAPKTKVIGVEPEGAPSMSISIEAGESIQLETIESFVDGAAVKQVGHLNFALCKEHLDDMITIPEGKVCQVILDLYNKEATVVEPAGALSIAALDVYKDRIKDKNIVCVISGSNNDITRTAEIKERALLHADLKHYFIIKFPQRAGALREFVADILGPNDDITHFEYTKKTNRENGAAVVGLELKSVTDLKPLIARMKRYNFYGDYLNDKPDLFQFLV